MSTSDQQLRHTRRLFINDPGTKDFFLIDTGTDLCVYPRSRIRGPLRKLTYEVAEANGSRISTYGTTALNLSLGLRRAFPWQFIIANVAKPIIGADFIYHYGLLVDLRSGHLIDKKTGLTSLGKVLRSNVPSVNVVRGNST